MYVQSPGHYHHINRKTQTVCGLELKASVHMLFTDTEQTSQLSSAHTDNEARLIEKHTDSADTTHNLQSCLLGCYDTLITSYDTRPAEEES